jgi:hypothetical protein
MKVWDCRSWVIVREWTSRGGGGEIDWSAKGTLTPASGETVNVRQNFVYVTCVCPSKSLIDVQLSE